MVPFVERGAKTQQVPVPPSRSLNLRPCQRLDLHHSYEMEGSYVVRRATNKLSSKSSTASPYTGITTAASYGLSTTAHRHELTSAD